MIFFMVFLGVVLLTAAKEVNFSACDDVENILGIESIDVSEVALKYGVVVATVKHKPMVELDGPAFLKIDVGPFSFFRGYCDMALNPGTLPLPLNSPCPKLCATARQFH
jgi:hypothetical protein